MALEPQDNADCSTCDVELNEENTADHNGGVSVNPFNPKDRTPAQCDSCVEKAIDRYLERLYE